MGLQFRCLPHLLWIGLVLVCCVTSFRTSPDSDDRWMSREEKRDMFNELVRQGLDDLGKTREEIETQIDEWRNADDRDRVLSSTQQLEEEQRAAAVRPGAAKGGRTPHQLTKVSPTLFEKFKKNDAFFEQLGDVLPGAIGATYKLAIFDFKNSSPKQIAKAVGDVIVPLVSSVLAVIPLVGPIISGLFTGVWGLFSSLLLEEKEKESPMEKMIKEAMKQMREEMDTKMATFLTNLIRGELGRNRYVCDKYALISENFTDNYVKGGQKLNDTFRLEMIMFLDNCDNFLLDTFYGFEDQNYPDALWQASAMAALAQIAFLTDTVNVGKILRLPKRFMTNYLIQIDNVIDSHFRIFTDGLPHRSHKLGLQAYSTEEVESCRTQAQLLYMDRSLYLYGVPRKFVARGNDSFHLDSDDLTMKDPKTGKPLEYDHIQIFTTVEMGNEESRWDRRATINCFMGPIFAVHPPTNFRMRISFIPGHSYQTRVLYFTNSKYDTDKIWRQSDSGTDKMKAVVKSNQDGHLVISLDDKHPNPDHHRLAVDGGSLKMECYGNLAPLNAETLENEPCKRVDTYWENIYKGRGSFNKVYREDVEFESARYHGGKFVIDDVGVFNMEGEGSARVEGSITLENPQKWGRANFVGVELIVRKEIK